MNRFDDQARLTFHYAREEANALGQALVGPAHLLLGMLRLSGPVREVLTVAGAPVGDWRETAKRASPTRPEQNMDAPSITPSARLVMETAARLTHKHGARSVGPQFILLALLELPDQVTQKMLAHLPVSHEKLREQLLALPEAKEPAEPVDSEALPTSRELIRTTRERSGVPPGNMGRAELLGLILTTAGREMLADLEPLVYDWLTGDTVPEGEKHTLLYQMLALAVLRRP